MIFKFILHACFLLSAFTYGHALLGANAFLPDLSQKPVMNGINPAKAAAFWEKWHLVTVRYRKDNEEQRFTYANDIAWKTLKAGGKTFPDGAMFGKIAFATKVDPAFPSSVETKDYTRIQLMLKDSKRFAKTSGWSYSLYVASNQETSGETSSVVEACHACHNLVPDRDFVFSRSSFHPGKTDHSTAIFKDQFQQRKVADLSPYSRSVLSAHQWKAATIQYFALPLFAGSLSEATNPMLIHAKEVDEPVLLVDEEHRLFFLARSLPPSGLCPVKSVEFSYLAMVQETGAKAAVSLRRGTVCNDQFTWSTQPIPTEIISAGAR